jgi:hypothetical protein
VTYAAPQHPSQYPPPPGASPAQRRSTTKVVLIVVAIVLVVLCIGGGLGGYALYQKVNDATKEPSNTTLGFLDAVKAGKPRDAYDHLCAQTKQRYSFEQFRLYVSGRPWPVDYTVKTVDIAAQDNNAGTAEVLTTLRYVEGSIKDHTFHLVREDGRWKVCSQTEEPY